MSYEQESESNDYWWLADPIKFGVTMKGAVGTDSDDDYFTFTVDGPGNLTVVVDKPEEYAVFFEIRLTNAAGRKQASWMVQKDKTQILELKEGGTYYLKISAFFSMGQYGLTATFAIDTSSDYETEANDTIVTADTVTSGKVIKGALDDFDDIDFYKITADSAGVLTVSFDSPTADNYIDYFNVTVYDQDGYLLSNQSAGDDIFFHSGLGAGGTYYVSVSSGWFHDSGQYGLTLTTTAGGEDGYEIESNDYLVLADLLTSGQTRHGQLSWWDDFDWFYINTPSAGSLTVDFDAPTDSGEFYISLLDEAGNIGSW